MKYYVSYVSKRDGKNGMTEFNSLASAKRDAAIIKKDNAFKNVKILTSTGKVSKPRQNKYNIWQMLK